MKKYKGAENEKELKNDKKSNIRRLKEKLSGVLEMPKEIVMNLPLITILGSEEVNIENFKGVIEYTEERIRVNTSSGVLRINGKRLVLKQITAENITVKGSITALEYIM